MGCQAGCEAKSKKETGIRDTHVVCDICSKLDRRFVQSLIWGGGEALDHTLAKHMLKADLKNS